MYSVQVSWCQINTNYCDCIALYSFSHSVRVEHNIFRRVEVEVEKNLHIEMNTQLMVGLKNRPYTSNSQKLNRSWKEEFMGQKGGRVFPRYKFLAHKIQFLGLDGKTNMGRQDIW